MKLVRLLDAENVGFGRGWIFRCNKAEYPYEDKVEFMIREERESPSGFALIVISGHKAGLTLLHIPLEARLVGQGIAKSWLIENWTKWIYPECPIEDVLVFRNII